MFDLSEYNINHPIYDIVNEKFNYDEEQVKKFMNKNTKVIGKMKDENKNGVISEGIFLKSKCYYVKSNDSKEIKKNKYDNYKSALNSNYTLNKNNVGIRSIKHNIYTMTQNKTCLTSLCDKVYLLDDGVNSLSYGHKDIQC